jgi:hypothetical protein
MRYSFFPLVVLYSSFKPIYRYHRKTHCRELHSDTELPWRSSGRSTNFGHLTPFTLGNFSIFQSPQGRISLTSRQRIRTEMYPQYNAFLCPGSHSSLLLPSLCRTHRMISSCPRNLDILALLPLFRLTNPLHGLYRHYCPPYPSQFPPERPS